MRRFLGCLALGWALLSCTREAAPSVSDYLERVTLAPTGNALRYTVALTFSKAATYSLQYRRAGGTEWSGTQPRTAEVGENRCPLMFLYPSTAYEYRVRIGDGLFSDVQTFTTGAIPPEVPVYDVTVDAGGPSEGYLLQWQATRPGWLTFCDMEGKVVWYESFEQAVRHVYFDPGQGRIAVLTGFREGANSAKLQRLCDRIIAIDLEGNRLVKWTASDENVRYPHHDIKLMPDGNLLLFNNVVRTFDLSSLGGGTEVPVYGEGFTILTPDGEVVRRWDVFDELDPVRDTYLDAVALDYDLLHGNSVNWDGNGDFYITLNRHSELWKIDGKTGKVLYRVGEHGNVQLDAPFPVGGLHAAVPLAPDRILCYNNGAGQSRGQVYRVDPAALTATLELDVVLPAEYSSADRSNVELLPDGRTLLFASTLARACIFTDLDGNILKVVSRTGIAYRSHWFPEVRY